MKKLLSADLARLWRSSIFWLLEGACFAFGAITYALAAFILLLLGMKLYSMSAKPEYSPVIGWLARLMPFSCGLLSTDHAARFDWRSLAAPFVTTLLLVGIGIGIFKRKNIR